MSEIQKAKLIPRQESETQLGKLPPQALDLEEAVLGALMLEKNAAIDVVGFLRSEHFYTEQHQEIYNAVIDLFKAAEPVDMRTVVNQLRKNGRLEVVGGAHHIAELGSRVSSSANIEFHARILVELSMKRELILLGSDIQHQSYSETVDVFSIIEKGNLILQEIMDNVISGRAERGMKEIATQVVQEQQARQTGKHSGLDSGYKSVDVLLNGFQKSDLIIVAARPGMGKTMFAVQALKQIAERDIPVGLISLEMSAQQLVERLAIGECEIDSDKVKRGRLDTIEFEQYMNACGKLAQLKIHIDDTPFMTVTELRARAIRMKTKYGIQALCIDYLQLIKGTNTKQNRDQEIGEITRTLKGIAKELDIPVIALSQLSRGVETRGGTKRPQLSDLRESGNIEQDADIVMFLYRPEYYKITVDEGGLPTFGLCEVIVAKHRNGSLDTVLLKFLGKFTRFRDWDYYPKVDQLQYIERSKDPLPNEDRQRYEVKDVLPKEKDDDLPF